ncbi:hypothetical protein BKA70DRAFT_1395324 [Coprinopsis sp. MPI-PUGE-AT-0042]|nr:hypothetical protein BKA70DRAFT_1395324 [Coprinopsis sp. MPI-PUGE-AT-0042]
MLVPDRDSEISRDNVERKSIDEQIKALQENIWVLRSRRNDLAPIARLPPEILSRVFLHCRWAPARPPTRKPSRRRYDREDYCPPDEESDNSLSLHERGKLAIDWHYFTFVSQQWRDAAIGCLALWSDISDDCSAAWTGLMLKRSKNAPLSVSMLTGIATTLKEWPLGILRDRGRLKNLAIGHSVFSFYAEVSYFISDLKTPAPLLETLSLAFWNSVGIHISIPVNTLPEGILADVAPKLRQLKLIQWVPVSWNCRLLSNLTHLKIDLTTTGESSVAPLPGKVFLDMLERMPTLEELDLSMNLPEVYNATCAGRVVPLLASKKLRVNETLMKPLSGLLKHTTLGVDTVLQIWCTVEKDQHTASIVEDFASSLDSSWITGSPLSTQPRPPVAHITIRDLNVQYGGSLYGTREAVEELVGINAQPPLQVIVHRSQRAIALLWEALPLSQLQHLSLGHGGTQAHFASLTRFSTIRHLTLMSTSDGIIQYVKSSSTPGRCFPALEEITLTDLYGKRQSAVNLIYLLDTRMDTGK